MEVLNTRAVSHRHFFLEALLILSLDDSIQSMGLAGMLSGGSIFFTSVLSAAAQMEYMVMFVQ